MGWSLEQEVLMTGTTADRKSSCTRAPPRPEESSSAGQSGQRGSEPRPQNLLTMQLTLQRRLQRQRQQTWDDDIMEAGPRLLRVLNPRGDPLQTAARQHRLLQGNPAWRHQEKPNN